MQQILASLSHHFRIIHGLATGRAEKGTLMEQVCIAARQEIAMEDTTVVNLTDAMCKRLATRQRCL